MMVAPTHTVDNTARLQSSLDGLPSFADRRHYRSGGRTLPLGYASPADQCYRLVVNPVSFVPQLTREQAAFARQEQLIPYVPLAEGLVRLHFHDAEPLGWTLDIDPETGSRSLDYRFRTTVEVEQFLNCFEALNLDWADRVPWPQVDQITFGYRLD